VRGGEIPKLPDDQDWALPLRPWVVAVSADRHRWAAGLFARAPALPRLPHTQSNSPSIVLEADEIDDAGTPARIRRFRSIVDCDNPKHYHDSERTWAS